MAEPRVATLRAAGVSLVVDATGPALPRILHRGRDLGPLTPTGVGQLALAAGRPTPLYAYVRVATAPELLPGRVRLPGLDPSRTYTVTHRTELDDPHGGHGGPPGWLEAGGVITLPGAALAAAGLQQPVLHPAHGILLHAVAT